MNSFSKKSGQVDISAWETPRLVDHENGNPKVSRSEVELRQGVYEEAFKEGYENGKELGLQEARDQLKLVNSLLSAMRKPYDEQTQEIAETVVLLAGRIARAVISRDLKTDPDMLLTLVRETISALNSGDKEVFVHLNPRSAQTIRELLSAEAGEPAWKIIDDPHVALDACKVRCQDSVVDADLDTRINVVISQMLDTNTDTSPGEPEE